jgi:ELWxxDGT repeat protein
VGGKLYFCANDGASGIELWKSDGTEAGTVRVKDILSGTGNSSPSLLSNVAGTLYFNASGGVNGNELWKSNGTDWGTVPVRLSGNLPLVNPTAIAEVGGRLYVAGTRPEVGEELFALDLFHVGDYDRNGIIQQADRTFWAANFGATTGVGLQADGNKNGVIDAADYTVWRDAIPTRAATNVAVASSAVSRGIFDSVAIITPSVAAPPTASPAPRPITASPPRRSDLLLVGAQQSQVLRNDSAASYPVFVAITDADETANDEIAALDAVFALLGTELD